MSRTVIVLIGLCLAVAALSAIGLFDPRDNEFETWAKGFGMLGMLLMALSLAKDATRAAREED